MRPKGPTLAWKIVAANSLLAVVAVLMVVTLEYRRDRRLLEATIRRELSQAVATGALMLEGSNPVALVEGSSTPEGREVERKLRSLQGTNPSLARLYILGRGPHEEPRLLSGLGGVDESRFAPGVRKSMSESLEREIPVQTGVYEDSDGQWLSAFHPIRDRKGGLVAVLGADLEASSLAVQAREKLRSTLLSGSAAVLLAVVLSLLVARGITRPLKLVAESASAIASGNLNICLNLRSKDEIGELADSFNRMVERLAEAAEEKDRLTREVLEKQRLEQELSLAAEIQQSFLPVSFPWSPHFHTNARSVPAQVVGGDFYDFLELDGERIGMVIGDVAGRGIAAAVYMARLISDFRSAALRTPSPREALEKLNQQLLSRSTRGMFVTMTYLVLDPHSGELRYSSGGHLPPLRRRGQTEEIEVLNDDQGLPLGITARPGLVEHRLRLEPEDALLLVTDGVVEALCEDRSVFNLDGLAEVFRRHSAKDHKVIDEVFDAIARHSSDRIPQDDMTALFLSWKTASATVTTR